MKGDVTVLNDLKRIFDEDDFDFVFHEAAVVGMKRTLEGVAIRKLIEEAKKRDAEILVMFVRMFWARVFNFRGMRWKRSE